MSMTLEQLLAALELGEDQEVEFKSAVGGLPKSLWETLSAFANTEGGMLVLGVSEHESSYEVEGVRKPQVLLKNFWDNHNNPQKLNQPVCKEADVSVLQVQRRSVLCIRVPQVMRQQRPVYINAHPMSGTYKRNFAGDYRCSENEVRRMLREASDEPLDGQILEGFDLADLDAESLTAFRNRFASRDPSHPFLALGEQDFLASLGAWRRDRHTHVQGLTLAGLLMFGKERSLLDALPNFHLDYQEQLSSDPDVRWTYRLTVDGKWVPNLFNFYYRVYARLVDGIETPFKTDEQATRQEETRVHEALREALVNTLVHADHQSSRPITISKRKDAFIFTDPGRLRIPKDQLYQGGVSDPRNPNLLKMFQMLGLGEKSGSGFQKILRAWREQHWLVPLVAENASLETIRVWLPIASMIPQDVEQELRSLVGNAYASLDELGRVILMLAHRFGEVSNEDIQHYRAEHPRDIGARLSQLAAAQWLHKSGRGRGTRYRWPGQLAAGRTLDAESKNETQRGQFLPAPPKSDRLLDADEPTGTEKDMPSSEHLEPSSEHLEPSSEHLEPSSEHLEPSSEHLDNLRQLADPVRGTKRAPKALVARTLLTLCQSHWLSLQTLAALLGRNPDALRNHYISPMLKDGSLQARVPDKPNHPGQAYRKKS